MTNFSWYFWTVVLEKILESPLDSKEIKPLGDFLEGINHEYSLEGPMLKLKLLYFGHRMGRASSLEKILVLGKIEGGRRRGQQRMRWLDGVTDSMHMNWANSWRQKETGRPGAIQFLGCKESDIAVTEQQQQAFLEACTSVEKSLN